MKIQNDILDTCENKPGKFSGVAVSKLIKKNRLFFLSHLAFCASVIIIFSSFQPAPSRTYGLTTVVIDAGHGGHDSGCLGKSSKEKDIALAISLKLGKYIEDNFQDVKVIYTRKTDEFVELYERAEIANNAHADLFICIHCNSACFFDRKKKKEQCNTETNGVESWVMGLHKTEANLEVAKRENEVILLEKDYTRQYDGFDPNSPEANIIFSLYQNTYLDQSLRMASYVQEETKEISRAGRGVKQAGFLVLYKTSMPSILIETGFLSNPAEEKYLSSEKGQTQIASSIYHAFKSYKNSVESLKGNSGMMQNEEQDDSSKKKGETQSGKKSVTSGDSPVVSKPSQNETAIVKPTDVKKEEPGVLQWSVQFYTSPTQLPDNSKLFKVFEDIREDFENKLYKYSTGLLESKQEAIELQSKVREMGYKDAFVIAIYNGKRITMKEANGKVTSD